MSLKACLCERDELRASVIRLRDELAALRARCSWDERVDPLTEREATEAFTCTKLAMLTARARYPEDYMTEYGKDAATVREVVCRRAILTEREP
jgi:hypothetical protein